MKIPFAFPTLLMVALLTACATNSRDVLPYKEWHETPPMRSAEAAAIPKVSWEKSQRLYIGMTEENIERVLGISLTHAHYRGNILIWSKTRGGIPVEIALRMEDHIITDISYRQP